MATQEEAAEYYADDYVFRGSVIGPITNKDVRETQEGFNIQDAYPDLDRGVFGLTVDPKNPFRCFFFGAFTRTVRAYAKQIAALPTLTPSTLKWIHESSCPCQPRLPRGLSSCAL